MKCWMKCGGWSETTLQILVYISFRRLCSFCSGLVSFLRLFSSPSSYSPDNNHLTRKIHSLPFWIRTNEWMNEWVCIIQLRKILSYRSPASSSEKYSRKMSAQVIKLIIILLSYLPLNGWCTCIRYHYANLIIIWKFSHPTSGSTFSLSRRMLNECWAFLPPFAIEFKTNWRKFNRKFNSFCIHLDP